MRPMSYGKRFSDQRGNTKGHSINGAARKDERRAAAFERDKAASKVSLADKLKALPTEGGNRQRARYTAQLAKEAEKRSQSSEGKKQNKAAKQAA